MGLKIRSIKNLALHDATGIPIKEMRQMMGAYDTFRESD